MNRWLLTQRTVVWHRGDFALLALAVAMTVGVVTGALLTGDSVHYSLARLSKLRRGESRAAVLSTREAVSATLGERLQKELGVVAAPVLATRGTVSHPATGARAVGVQVCGVDARFWSLSLSGKVVLGDDGNECAVNQRLANELDLTLGEWFVVRMMRASSVPRDAAFSDGDSDVASLRVRITTIVDDNSHGRFSLHTHQISPPAIYIPLRTLAHAVDAKGMANLFLVGSEAESDDVRTGLEKVWSLTDVGLHFDDVPVGKGIELTSDRVFISRKVVEAARKAEPKATPLLSYLVDTIECRGASTPYSFVTGSDGLGPSRESGKQARIILNRWLADDLSASVGSTVRLDYSVPGSLRTLEKCSAEFVVSAIVDISGKYADRELMPEFPGLAEAGDCADWDTALPIDMKRIRQKDEDYWDSYRGTPKAFIDYETSVRLWGNRFGAATAVRFSERKPEAMPAVMDAVREQLTADEVGLYVRDLAQEGIKGSDEAVDFSQLFLGLSFFVIVSGLLLSVLVLSLSLDSRRQELATLLTVGFEPSSLRGMICQEVFLASIPGACVGILLGVVYNSCVLSALAGGWSGAVAGAPLVPYITMRSLVMGGLSGILLVLAAVWFFVRKLSIISIAAVFGRPEEPVRTEKSRKRWCILAVVLLAVSATLAVTSDPGRGKAAAGVFFAVGMLSLAGLMCLTTAWLGTVRPTGDALFRAFAIRGVRQKPGRSLAVVMVVACAVFLVMAVGANRHLPGAGRLDRSSGTGGFSLYGELSVPVSHDLKKELGEMSPDLQSGTFSGRIDCVQMSASDGDDVSCLNLNRSHRPRILGVDPEELASRKAFSAVRCMKGVDAENVWDALSRDMDDGAIPAIMDHSAIVWGLGSDVGKTITVVDEQGREVRLRFVAGLGTSVLQGSVLVSRDHFQRLFPSSGGTRVVLIDTDPQEALPVKKAIARILRPYGPDMMLCAKRLNLFAEVENTYLAIFLSLGFLGVVLGTVGAGILVQRNVLEREGQLALMQAVGFQRARIAWQLMWEHAFLMSIGVGVGAVSAVLAVLPALRTGGGAGVTGALRWIPALLICGVIWPALGAVLATRRPILDVLGREQQ